MKKNKTKTQCFFHFCFCGKHDRLLISRHSVLTELNKCKIDPALNDFVHLLSLTHLLLNKKLTFTSLKVNLLFNNPLESKVLLLFIYYVYGLKRCNNPECLDISGKFLILEKIWRKTIGTIIEKIFDLMPENPIM